MNVEKLISIAIEIQDRHARNEMQCEMKSEGNNPAVTAKTETQRGMLGVNKSMGRKMEMT